MPSRLTPLQERVLAVLAPMTPRWTLTGGGALAGFHLGHRSTRDLDLFWHGRAELGELPREVRRRLEAAGLTTEGVQTTPAFERLRVRGSGEELIVDLVAERVPTVSDPLEVRLGSQTVFVDSPHEILVNKLGTLLQRRELRDLVDVRALLERDGDLEAALRDAPRKDGGFSPLMVAWILERFPVTELAPLSGLTAAETRELERFKLELIARLTRAAGA